VIYWLARALVRIFFRVVGSWQIEGRENVPAKGALLLAPNHLSFLDPPLVGCALKRSAWFMAKAELFHVPVFKWLIPKLHAYPVQRGSGDRAALKHTLGLLAAGEAVTMFPEGTRSQTGELGEPELGIGMIALRSGAPIVPMAIAGTDDMLPRGAHFLKRARVRVRFGKPIPIPAPEGKPGREEYAAVAKSVMDAIRALREGL
jgi:1-acyl-sn-glycerol-3-phosphate acyltransferase